MNNVLWIGVYPGLTEEMLDYVVETITQFALKPEARLVTVR
jgi:CDP-6-deoxy-D-xylo-4-hexulose-3-dehydrase